MESLSPGKAWGNVGTTEHVNVRTYLEQCVQDNFCDATFVDVSPFEENLGRAFSNPSGDEKRPTACTGLLRWGWLHSNTKVGCCGRTGVQISKRLQMAFARTWPVDT